MHTWNFYHYVILSFSFLCSLSLSLSFISVLGIEPSAIHMLGKHFTTEIHPKLPEFLKLILLDMNLLNIWLNACH
jgi:hypothetical protein